MKKVTFMGNPLTLEGSQVAVGENAPDALLIDNEMNMVPLKSFTGKVLVIASVPSLDTPVCDMETRRFNEEAGKMGSGAVVLTVSMDLPFAQARWCGSAGIENVKTLSDYREASFGRNWGVLIKELRLLARAVFVVDGGGTIRHAQIVPEITEHPDYDAVLAAVAKLK